MGSPKENDSGSAPEGEAETRLTTSGFLLIAFLSAAATLMAIVLTLLSCQSSAGVDAKAAALVLVLLAWAIFLVGKYARIPI